jgi:hypothetical protein
MGKFSQFDNLMTYNDACLYARGSYQQGLLDGVEAISGSTLRGQARKWKSKYKESSDALIRRLKRNGFKVEIVIGKFRRHVLSVSRPVQKERVARLMTDVCTLRLLPHSQSAVIRCARNPPWYRTKMSSIHMARKVYKPLVAALYPDMQALSYVRSIRRTHGTA